MSALDVFHLPLQISVRFTLLCCPRKLCELYQQTFHCLCALLGLATGDLQQEMGGRSKFIAFIPLVLSLQVHFRPSVFLSRKSLHLKAANSMWLLSISTNLFLSLPFGLRGDIIFLTTGSGSLLYLKGAICFLGHWQNEHVNTAHCVGCSVMCFLSYGVINYRVLPIQVLMTSCCWGLVLSGSSWDFPEPLLCWSYCFLNPTSSSWFAPSFFL